MAVKSSAKTATTLAAVQEAGVLAVEAPAGPSAEVLSDTSVRLSWSSVDDPLTFLVAWAPADVVEAWSTATAPGDARSYVVEGLRPGTSYTFRVQTQSTWSTPVEAATTGLALEAPVLTVSDILDRNANITVLTPSLAGRARLVEAQVRDTRQDSPWYAITEVPWNISAMGPYEAGFGLRGLSTGVLYAVRARVTADGMTSDWSQELRFTTTGTKGGKPSISVVPDSATYSSVKLAWGTSVKSIARIFRWTRATSPGWPFLPQQVMYSTELSGTFTDTGLASGTDYWYTVEWMRDVRTYSVSNPVAARTRG